MSTKTVTLRLSGIAPLLLHNGALADPLNKFAKLIKEVSSKRKKTDADLEEMARLEFLGSLYVNEERKVVIPADLIEATLVAGAKKSKRGNEFKAGILIKDDACLAFEGADLSPDELWQRESYRFRKKVKVGTSGVMRTRPIFDRWSFETTVEYTPELIRNEDEIVAAFRDAGAQVGIGDWRPRFGRFEVAKVV